MTAETVTQDMIDRVCAGVRASQADRDAVWQHVRQLQNEVEDLRAFIDGMRSHVKAAASMYGLVKG